MEQILRWLDENASAVQAGASLVSLVIAVVVAWFGVYSIRLFRLEKARARAEHMKFIVALANLATDFNEFVEAFRSLQQNTDNDAEWAFLEEHVKQGQLDLEELRQQGADVPARVYFCLETAARKLERLEFGFKPAVVRNPMLSAGIYLDLKGVRAALFTAYQSIPMRQRRERWWHRDYVEERSAVSWEIELPHEFAKFRSELTWYQRLVDRIRGHRQPPKQRMKDLQDRLFKMGSGVQGECEP